MRPRLLLLILSGLVLLTPGALGLLRAAEVQQLAIASKTGVHQFTVEMALTEEDKAHGLMFRRDLPEGRGMLFDFFRERTLSFWMKDTYVSLDIVFIRADG